MGIDALAKSERCPASRKPHAIHVIQSDEVRWCSLVIQGRFPFHRKSANKTRRQSVGHSRKASNRRSLWSCYIHLCSIKHHRRDLALSVDELSWCRQPC